LIASITQTILIACAGKIIAIQALLSWTSIALILNAIIRTT
jgi:hypothetical protein